MNTSPATDTITYIITVHGMGEQRDNETLTPVASRLVDVIRDIDGNTRRSYPRNTLSLGQVTGQEQTYPQEQWTTFDGLTMDALSSGHPNYIFNGCESDPHDSPECIRFSDIYWQDILQKHWPQVGQNTDAWVSAVVSRIFQADHHPARLKSLIYTLEQTIDILYYASKFKLKAVNSTAFEQYLGDVQIYTESAGCRKEAWERFIDNMDMLHASTKGTPRYIIIAHSLGTVMSMDALIKAARLEKPWLENIESYVTLGSPIDKIITLWDFNYKHLHTHVPALATKISHYNYSDEQDPVGYYINEAAKRTAYKDIFEKKEDIVYNHSVVPGMAHVTYWEDIELFRHIVRTVIAPKKRFDDTMMWFKKNVYTAVMGVTYFLIPLFVSAINILTLTLALDSDNWQARAVSSLGFVATSWLGKQILSLMVSWRLAANRGSHSKPFSHDPVVQTELDKHYVNKGAKYLLWFIMVSSVVLPAALFIWNPWNFGLVLTWGQFWPFLATTSASFVFVLLFFRKKRKRQMIIGNASSNDLSTALTISLAAILFMIGIMRGHITNPITTDPGDSTSVRSTVFAPTLFVSNAFAQQPTKQAQRPLGKIDTQRRQVVIYDTIRRSVMKVDTVRRHVDIIDTIVQVYNRNDTVTSVAERVDTVIRSLVRVDTSYMRDTIVPIDPRQAKNNIPLLYFSSVMTAFICFTYSALKYLFEKGKIKAMAKLAEEAKMKTT
ncbi:MAG TPA: hypothetical protein VIX80_06410 [Candidatus Kapabacteria bacterium]